MRRNRETGIVINFFHNWLILACELRIYKLNLKSTSQNQSICYDIGRFLPGVQPSISQAQ